jgi:PAS domain S-box-containing protein
MNVDNAVPDSVAKTIAEAVRPRTTPVIAQRHADLTRLHSLLHARHTTIIAALHAVMITAGLSLPTPLVRSRFASLLDQITAALLADSFDRAAVECIGAAFVELLDSHPGALAGTLEVLGRELLAPLPADVGMDLQPRLGALLGALAAGWARRAQERARMIATPSPGVSSPGRLEPHGTAGYRLLVEGIPAITYIAVFDAASSTIYTSPQIETILGFSQAEWMADHTLWLTQIHPDDRARVLTDLDRIHAGGAPAPCEYRMRTRDGRVVWFRDEVAVMHDADGRPSGLYGIMLDISERKRVEAELADVRRRLADARDAERLRLARDLHDDAIQHLLGVGLLIDESQQRLAASPDVETVTVVHAVALERIRAAVQAVATQLRGVIGELRPAGLDSLGLTAALESYVAGLRHEGGPALPAIALDLDPSGAALPRAIALCLFRAAQEALRNAIQHAQARRMHLRLRLDGASVSLSIRDDGYGMGRALNLKALIAARHFGLAGIVERVAEVGGHLTIESVPRQGTTLTVMVPL